MNQKEYTPAEIEITRFSTEDIILTSDGVIGNRNYYDKEEY